MKSRFFNKVDKFNGTFTQLEENSRRWEKLYRQRWAHDKALSEQLMESTVQAHVLECLCQARNCYLGTPSHGLSIMRT